MRNARNAPTSPARSSACLLIAALVFVAPARRLARRTRLGGRAHQDLHQSRRADRAEPRARARRLRHRDRRGRPRAHHRLSDGRGARGRDHHQCGPHRAGDDRRLRSRNRLRHPARDPAAEGQAARVRPLRRREGERSGADRERRRARHGVAGARRGQARIRRQLGIPARRGDLHDAAASGLERRGADLARGQAARRRLADRRRYRRRRRRRRPATCSCRSTGCRRSSAT